MCPEACFPEPFEYTENCQAWEDEKLLDFFNSQKGLHFDPVLIDIFMSNLDDFYSRVTRKILLHKMELHICNPLDFTDYKAAKKYSGKVSVHLDHSFRKSPNFEKPTQI